MTRTDLVTDLRDCAKPKLLAYFEALPPERGMRLDGIEAELRSLTEEMSRRWWEVVLGGLQQRAEQQAGTCAMCQRRCSREEQQGSVVVLGRRPRGTPRKAVALSLPARRRRKRCWSCSSCQRQKSSHQPLALIVSRAQSMSTWSSRHEPGISRRRRIQ